MGERRVVRAATDEEALRLGLVPGTRAVWVDETTEGRAPHAWNLAGDWAQATRRCRWMLSNPRRACGARPVALLWRTRGGRGLTPWFYCADHLYGRQLEDGRILALTRIPEGEA